MSLKKELDCNFVDSENEDDLNEDELNKDDNLDDEDLTKLNNENRPEVMYT